MYHVLRMKEMIKRHEGQVKKGSMHVIYDDETGKPIKKGDKLKGTPTIGYGINLADVGITDKQADTMMNDRIAVNYQLLAAAFHAYHHLDRVRQDIIMDMCFNMGIEGLTTFKKMWTALEKAVKEIVPEKKLEYFRDAAAEMLDSKWQKQVGRRAAELALMMIEGKFFTPEERKEMGYD